MKTRTHLKLAASGLVLCAIGIADPARADVSPVEYDAVIHAARAGHAASAVEQLQTWHLADADNKKILYDLIVVLGWANDFTSALAYADGLIEVDTPAYVLKSIGDSARGLARWDDAERAYRLALRNNPNDIDTRTGLVDTMLGRKQYDEALEYVQRFLPEFESAYQRSDVPMILLLGHVRMKRSEALPAVEAYRNALHLDPQSRAAFRGYVFALGAAGMPYLAARTADRHLDFFSVEEQQQIAHTAAGRTVNFGEAQLAIDERQPRFQTTDAALDETGEVLKRFGERPATLFDRMVALRDRQMMKDVVELYTALSTTGIAIPPYAQAAAADAYLYLEQPETARDLYKSALAGIGAGDVANVDSWRIGLAYAYSEAEQHDEAQQVADGVTQTTPELANKGIRGVEAPNADYPTATVTSGLMRMYADRLKEAEARLAVLRSYAPFNGQTRLAWASLQSSREHPRAALDEFTLMHVDDPKSVDAQIGRGDSWMTLNQFSETKALVPELVRDYPEDKGVQALTRKVDIHDRPFLRIDTTFGKGSEAAGAETVFDAWLYSEPLTNSLGEPYRVFTHVSRSSGNIDGSQSSGDDVARTRIGAGVDYRVRDLTVEAEVNRAVENAEHSGIAVALAKDFSDAWQIQLGVDSNVNDLASAAYDNDVTARRVTAGITWKQDESRRIDAALSATDFSDGNRRNGASIAWTERWISGPVFKLDSVLGLAASRNSLSDAAYFNPASDSEATVTLIGEWRTWRHYRRWFVQQVQVYVGSYQQENFGSGATSGVQYGHEWSFDDAFTLGYGVGTGSHPYDGVRENHHYGYLTLTWAIK